MTRQLRAIVLTAAVALAFLAAVNVGTAKPDARQFQNLPPCAAGQQPTYENPCMPAGGIPQGGGQQGGMPQGGIPQGGGQQGGMPQGGGMMRPDMPACAAGVMPTRDAPCKINMDMKECGPEGPPKLNADGSLPAGAVPCRPAGAVQFDQAPPTEATDKLMTLDVEVDGSGEKPGTFDVTLVRIGFLVAQVGQRLLGGDDPVLGIQHALLCLGQTSLRVAQLTGRSHTFL